MPTAHGDIAAAIVARLQSSPAVCPVVLRSRMRPIAEQDSQAVVVRLGRSVAERTAILGAPIQWMTDVQIECYAEAAATPGDAAVDDLLQAVYTRLMADKSLGGRAQDVMPQDIEWDNAAQAMPAGCATLTVQVVHTTGANTLT